MKMHGIAYSSEAYPMTTEELTELLESARRFNARVGVTGVLFHHSGRFFQYFEGSEDAVREVHARIIASPRHHSLRLLLDTPLTERHFVGWHMGFCESPVNEFQAIANDDWANAMPLTRATIQRPEPLALVLSYWSRWIADRPVD
ncbi:MAG: BLUF domain-containing protein [Pseudomonadota bacterium]